jgi:hypothetical protein
LNNPFIKEDEGLKAISKEDQIKWLEKTLYQEQTLHSFCKEEEVASKMLLGKLNL